MIQLSTFSVFGWFQNMTANAGLMTWFGICVVRIHLHSFPAHIAPLTICGPSRTDLPPLPSWLERPRSRPEPPPIQILPPTLRRVVWPRVYLYNPHLQWIFRLPSW